MEKTLVKSLLKKLGQKLVKKYYRGVSNLSGSSKLVEAEAIQQLSMHIQGLMPGNLSAYKEYHSLLYINDEALNYIEKGKVMSLCVVDLSTMFNTVDNKILLKVLLNKYGVVRSIMM